MDQQRKERRKKEEKSKEDRESRNYIKIVCRYWFACMISLLYLACMVLHVVLCCLGMGFSRCDSVFNLTLSFLDSHGVVEFSCFF